MTHGSFCTGGRDKDILSGAKFAFFRDSVSLEKAKADGVTCPVMEFGPDGAFACDVRDDAQATAFLQANALEAGKFLCCIPRLRWTPYWEIRGTPMDARANQRHARNEAMAEHDHAPLRDAIIAVVRETSLKVLVCPEDMSQMAVGKRWIVDKLPADVRGRVVWREKFWLTDEALSTYLRSAGMFALEMHSPIMCIGNGVPAIVCRFAEQTSKGVIWRDIGLASGCSTSTMRRRSRGSCPPCWRWRKILKRRRRRWRRRAHSSSNANGKQCRWCGEAWWVDHQGSHAPHARLNRPRI